MCITNVYHKRQPNGIGGLLGQAESREIIFTREVPLQSDFYS